MESLVLQDWALVPIILSYLSASELLGAESVCRHWRAVINSDPTLLQRLYLRPGSLTAPGTARGGFNPLLLKHFPLFLDQRMPGLWRNRFDAGLSNGGPWAATCCRDYMFAEGKWRRMLPCYPPVTRLVVHLIDLEGRGGEVAWMDFQNTQDSSKANEAPRSHPNWLTFGLMFDVIEAAWFQGIPHYAEWVKIVYPDFGGPIRNRQSLTRGKIAGHEDLQPMLTPGDGKVVIEIYLNTASCEERQQQHEKERNDEAEYRKKNRRRRRYHSGWMKEDKHIYTDEFHFADGLSFDDITWDHKIQYSLPPPPPNTGRPATIRVSWTLVDCILHCLCHLPCCG